MAAGDASRTWFSEMVETLRREWKPEMPWEEVIVLRDHLDSMLEEIRLSRGIRPPSMWCPVCNRQTQQAPPSVSVRALIFALSRFGIVAAAEFRSLEKRWAKHRDLATAGKHFSLTSRNPITDSTTSERGFGVGRYSAPLVIPSLKLITLP